MIEKKVSVPEQVTVEINDREFIVKGPKGELKRNFEDPRFDYLISFKQDNNEITISSESEKRNTKALVGTIAAHLRNMIRGVQEEYVYKMKIVYIHFPMTVESKDGKVFIKNFLGEKGARITEIVGDTKVNIQKDEITISSINREYAGQTAANIEQMCKVKKRDRRVFQDGVYIIEKPVNK